MAQAGKHTFIYKKYICIKQKIMEKPDFDLPTKRDRVIEKCVMYVTTILADLVAIGLLYVIFFK